MRAGRLPSPFEWFCLVGGLFLLFRYLWILDDAFVYFRYVDNLLFLKRGFVFNAGEYVEGFSSPFWAMLLIVLRSTGLDYWILTKALAVGCFVAFWMLAVRLNRRMSGAGIRANSGGPPSTGVAIVNAPLAYLCFAYGPLCYFSSGIETPFVQIAAVVFALFALNPRSMPLSVALAVSPLVRHELALPLLICVVWAWQRTGKLPWRLLGMSTLFVGAWLLFRVIYYADFLPNTFYLKNDVNIAQGLVYVHQTFATYSLYWVMLFFGVAAWWLRRSAGSDGTDEAPNLSWGPRAVMFVCAAAVTVYVIKIGGDPRHYRFLAFPFVLFAMSFAGLAEGLVSHLRAGIRPWAAPALGLAVAAVAFAGVPPQLEHHPVGDPGEHERVQLIGDAHWHRIHPAITFDADRAKQDRERREYYRSIASRPAPAKYRNCTLCYPAFMDINSRYIHRLGLTDAILARTDAKADRPAHKYSLVERAHDLARVLNAADSVDSGVYARARAAGTAPAWIEDGAESVDVVARKIYNEHRFLENLRLAFTFPSRIHVPRWQDEEGETEWRERKWKRSRAGTKP